MSVEVNIGGMRCGAAAGGLDCVYCYQGPVRGASSNAAPSRIDHEAIRSMSFQPGGEQWGS